MLQTILLQTETVVGMMESHEEKLNILQLLFDRGSIWITIPLLVMSMIMVYIFVDRYIAVNKAGKEDVNFMNNIRDFMHHNRLDSALALCRATNTPLSRMIEKGLSRLGRPLSDINETISNVGQMEVTRLEKGMGSISMMANIAPMLGFLGTVVGMIIAFHDMANSGNNLEIKDLSSGIYTALITTVSGLVVGIIGFIGYSILVSKVNKVVLLMESKASDFMDLLHEPAN